MRGKRAKQYKKLMQQYGMSFGFREPYQVLLDAEIIKDADRFKMDLVSGLERILHGRVKPMISQCSIRHLYADSKEPGMSFVIDKAKAFERRRCGHLPEDYPEPLSTTECLASVVDPKGSGTNKHRYVVASQDLSVRKHMRAVKGVPLMYINRSVMIMEPMAGESIDVREREEKQKFRDGIKRTSGGSKRKRGDEEEGLARDTEQDEGAPKKKKRRGPKEPNPLSVKKPKKKIDVQSRDANSKRAEDGQSSRQTDSEALKKKRKRTRKRKTGTDDGEGTGVEPV